MNNVTLLRELVDKYKGSAAGVDRALEEFESALGRKASKEEFDEAMGTVRLSKSAAADTEVLTPSGKPPLTPSDVEARAAERAKALPGRRLGEQPALPPPTDSLPGPLARMQSDVAVPSRESTPKVAVLGQIRPKALPPGQPPAPAPLRALTSESPASSEQLSGYQQSIKEADLGPKERLEANSAVSMLRSGDPEQRKKGLSTLQKLGIGSAVVGGAAALMPGGQEPSITAQKTPAPAGDKKQMKKEVASVISESKEEYPMASSLKLTEPADASAILRAADKEVPDSKLPADLRAGFAEKRKALETRLADAERSYLSAVENARDERQKRDAVTAFAKIFEQVGLALTSYYAAKEGAAMGRNVSGNVSTSPSDFNKAFDRSLVEYDQLVKEQKGLLDFRARNVEKESELLGRQEERLDETEARKAERAATRAFQERERLASESFRAKEGAEKRAFDEEQAALDRTSRERIAKLGVDSRESIAALRQQYSGQLAEAKADQKKQAALNKVTGIVGTWENLDSRQKQAGLNEINQHLTEAGLEDLGPTLSKAATESKPGVIGNLWRGITGGQTATQQAVGAIKERAAGVTAGGVRMMSPDGRPGVVPADKVQEAEAKGFKRL